MDSGVIWRVLDPKHPEREPCLELVRKYFTQKPELMFGLNAVVVVETMILLVKRSKIDPRTASSLLWNGFLRSESKVAVYPIYRDTLREALNLQSKNPEIEYPDCEIAATMKENGITSIYTTNPKHFKRFSFIKEAIDPRGHNSQSSSTWIQRSGSNLS